MPPVRLARTDGMRRLLNTWRAGACCTVMMLWPMFSAALELPDARPGVNALSRTSPSAAAARFDRYWLQLDFNEGGIVSTPDQLPQRLGELKSLIPPGDDMRQGRYEGMACWSNPADVPIRIAAAKSSIAQAKAKGQAYPMAWLTYCHATLTIGRVDDDTSLKLANEAVALAQTLDDDLLKAVALETRGENNSWYGNHAQALLDYQAAEAISVQAQLPSYYQERIRRNLSTLFRRMGDWEKAEQYGLADLRRGQEQGNVGLQIFSHLQLGYVYEGLLRPETARAHYESAAKLCVEHDNRDDIGYTQLGLASTSVTLNQPRRALQEATLAETSFKNAAISEEAAVSVIRARANAQLGNAELALRQFNAAAKVWESQKQIRLLGDLYERRSAVHENLGNTLAALQDYKNLVKVNKALYSNLTSQQTLLSKGELEQSRRELENERLQAERQAQAARLREMENTRRWQSVALLSIGGLLIAAVLFGMRQVRHLRQTRAMAMTDPLTRVMNKRGIDVFAEQSLKESREQSTPLCALMLDVDHFKHVNDTYGHAVGDVVLSRVAASVSAMLRRTDRIGRVGGEEFLVVLPHTDLNTARQIGERLRENVQKASMADLHTDLAVTVSYGISQWREDDGRFADVVKRADEGLYQAKRAGRNQGVSLP